MAFGVTAILVAAGFFVPHPFAHSFNTFVFGFFVGAFCASFATYVGIERWIYAGMR